MPKQLAEPVAAHAPQKLPLHPLGIASIRFTITGQARELYDVHFQAARCNRGEHVDGT